MSKTDAQRAMREANYAASQARRQAANDKAANDKAAPAGKATPKVVKPAVVEAPDTLIEEPAAESEGLCGHRSINNKSCQRPAGHAETSHRYK